MSAAKLAQHISHVNLRSGSNKHPFWSGLRGEVSNLLFAGKQVELLAMVSEARTIEARDLRGSVLKFYVRSWFTGGAMLAAPCWANTALAQDISGDPQGAGVLVSAVQWLEGTLLGTIATVIAVIAVASIGLLMLTGRTNWRRGATVILGCFILFGAPSIAAGIQSAVYVGFDPEPPQSAPVEPSPVVVSAPKPVAPSTGNDPYAGASLPPR